MNLSLSNIEHLLTTSDPTAIDGLFAEACRVRDEVYGRKVFMRGLIEITNHCKNNCLYCGIRREVSTQRYRLTKEQILDCCRIGNQLGFRTFVLQGGEDGWFTDDVMCDIVKTIKKEFPHCAVTLSLGERGKASFQRLFDAGADRYLLRHETADAAHYAYLHPNEMRKDLQFIQDFRPEMVGIGPFIPAAGTPFESRQAGSVELTLRLLAIIRILHPRVLLPATTALGTLHPNGRERAVMAGANVVMPNLSPQDTRALYSIYNNKLSTGSEAAESAADIRLRMKAIGMETPVDRGDFAY